MRIGRRLERSPCDGITEEVVFPVIWPSRRRPTGGEQEFATSRHWPEAALPWSLRVPGPRSAAEWKENSEACGLVRPANSVSVSPLLFFAGKASCLNAFRRRHRSQCLVPELSKYSAPGGLWSSRFGRLYSERVSIKEARLQLFKLMILLP